MKTINVCRIQTVVVGSSKIEKSNQCKYLGVTIDKHLDFQTQTKMLLEKMAVDIKTIVAMQNKFPATDLFMLFHALLLSHLKFLAFLLQITSPLLSLE